MCGGFAFFDDFDFKTRFQIEFLQKRPSYNIRPTMMTPVIYSFDGERHIDEMKFGVVPAWAKDDKIAYKMFNARSESLFDKTTWKQLVKSKRCIIPANGFYEWQKRQDGKHPMFIHPKDQKLFSFAGIYSHWTNPATKEDLMSFAIITTTPNKEMTAIHDRMPVIFTPEDEINWLSDEDDQGFVESMLDPYPNNHLEMYEVSTAVNSASNQGEGLIKPRE